MVSRHKASSARRPDGEITGGERARNKPNQMINEDVGKQEEGVTARVPYKVAPEQGRARCCPWGTRIRRSSSSDTCGVSASVSPAHRMETSR